MHWLRFGMAIISVVVYSASLADANWIKDANGCSVVSSESPRLKRRVPAMDAMPGTVVWQGQCIKGYAEGEGKLEWKSSMGFLAKEYYQGAMRRGKRSGQGKLYAHEYGTFTGEWVDDELVSGSYASTSGNVSYSGGFHNGQYHGRGVLKASGSILTGVWDKGELLEVISEVDDPPYKRLSGVKIQGGTIIKSKPKVAPAAEPDAAQ